MLWIIAGVYILGIVITQILLTASDENYPNYTDSINWEYEFKAIWRAFFWPIILLLKLVGK